MADFRVTVVGAGAVGKSAITVRFIQGNFVEKYDPTIEDSYRKQLDIDSQACMLDIMDTAGQEEYSALRDQYMKTGGGFVIVYSVTTRQSFEQTTRLYNNIMGMKGEDREFPIVLVGNKKDLEDQRVVSLQEGQEHAASLGVPFLEASAKTNENIQEIFITLVRRMKEWRAKYDKGPKKKGCSIL